MSGKAILLFPGAFAALLARRVVKATGVSRGRGASMSDFEYELVSFELN